MAGAAAMLAWAQPSSAGAARPAAPRAPACGQPAAARPEGPPAETAGSAAGWRTWPGAGHAAAAALAAAVALRTPRRQSDARRRWAASPRAGRCAAAATALADPPAAAAVREGQACIRGVLPNGLRYVVLRHTIPAGRVEAHLEFHVGSVDEDDSQRGMAHMMEHICFLGSERRMHLQSRGVGMTSNALTDFNQTVFHLSLGTQHLAEGLQVLEEVGFSPAFRRERIEKERAAVLSEAQMVNDVNYRLQMQMLGATHAENPIHARFPIGLESQIAGWTEAELRRFHSTWYTPENATLWVVGDVPEEQAVAEVERAFGRVPSRGAALLERSWEVDLASLGRPPMPGRPAVLHDYTASGQRVQNGSQVPALRGWSSDLRVSVATNDLVQGMQICWVAKLPLWPARSADDLQPWLCTRLVVEALRLRLQTRWSSGTVPCNFHAYDSHREGVSLATLTMLAEPARWRDTCQDALQEVLAVARHGLDADEVALAKRLVLGRVEEAARTQPWALMGTLYGNGVASTSREVVEAMIASAPHGHWLTDVRSFSKALLKACDEVDVKRLNTAAQDLLGHFGTAGPPCGTVVVSTPAYIVEEFSGRRIPFAPPSREEVVQALSSTAELTEEQVRQRKVAIPTSLLPKPAPVQPVERQELPGGVVALRLPNGLRVRMLVHAATPDGPAQSTMRLTAPGGAAADAAAGTLGSLDIGLRVLESCGVGEWSREQVQLFKRMSNVGTDFRAAPHAAELDLHFVPSATSRVAALEWLHWLVRAPAVDMAGFQEAQLQMKGQAHAREKALDAKAMQMLKQELYPRDPWMWSVPLEQINRLTLGQARKAVQAIFADVGSLQLEIACSAAQSSMQGSAASGLSHDEEADRAAGAPLPAAAAADLAAPGALDELRRTLEAEVCSALGALPAASSGAAARAAPLPAPVMSRRGCEIRAHVPDADERATVLIAGGAPGYWGRGDATWEAAMGAALAPWLQSCSTHPLYASMALTLMVECMNIRLLGRIRDQLSLTYSCDMELTAFEAFNAGHFVCRLFAEPQKLAAAAAAAAEVLRSPATFPFTEWEVEAAKRSMAYNDGKGQRERGYWLDKLRPLPGAAGMGPRPEEERRVLSNLRVADAQLAWGALTNLEDPFVVLATSGRPAVASLVRAGPVVQRSPRPDPQPAAAPSGGGSGPDLDMLD